MPNNPSPDSEHQVIAFRRNAEGKPAGGRHLRGSSPVGDLREFEQTPDMDDYRHRMMINVAAAAFTLMLIFAGLWLADALSVMRKNQDCVLSGRRGCTPVDAPVQPRGGVSSLQQR